VYFHDWRDVKLLSRLLSMQPTLVRIGELARRTGVSADVLRAWERRYGVLDPQRSPGGFRLYGPADEERVRAMRRHLDRGLAAAEAAKLALAEGEWAPQPEPGTGLDARLLDALLALDEGAAEAELDRLLAAFTVETVLRDAILPALHELGERWERGEATVAQEHFASGVVRGRLLGLARGWSSGAGPRALLACPPGELHDLGLLGFGLALRGRGWRVTSLGADTPIATLAEAAALLEPELVVVAALDRAPLAAAAEDLRALAARRRLALGGAGADAELAERVGATLLPADVTAAADAV
jgi:DNA-binding transcriptional MerR regulator